MHKITIGIPAYNAHQTIEKTLISISAFINTSIINVIVVDDGSNDHYDSLIEPFLK
jgi:glycosyltransferase involved in cell wall biosynthesis